MSELDSRREFMGKTGAAAGMAALATALLGDSAHAATELNTLGPTPEQLQEFMKLPNDTPVVMVNLLKFKDPVAYQKYGVEVGKLLNNIGAEVIFSGACKMALIGGASWDHVALVRYPNAQALMKMSQSPEYLAIHHYREEGLEGQINLAVYESGVQVGQAANQPGDVTADQIMSQMDANGDGKIDMDEAPEQLKAAFGMVDANADGGIDLSEAQMIADFMNGQ